MWFDVKLLFLFVCSILPILSEIQNCTQLCLQPEEHTNVWNNNAIIYSVKHIWTVAVVFDYMPYLAKSGSRTHSTLLRQEDTKRTCFIILSEALPSAWPRRTIFRGSVSLASHTCPSHIQFKGNTSYKICKISRMQIDSPWGILFHQLPKDYEWAWPKWDIDKLICHKIMSLIGGWSVKKKFFIFWSNCSKWNLTRSGHSDSPKSRVLIELMRWPWQLKGIGGGEPFHQESCDMVNIFAFEGQLQLKIILMTFEE